MSRPSQQPFQIEWGMILAALGLLGMGAVFIYSATSGRLVEANLHWYEERFVRQLVAAALGVGLAAVVCLVEYQIIRLYFMI